MSARQADKAWAGALHKARRKMLVYTVNDPKEYERLRHVGVDGVFTNFPDLRSPSPAKRERAGVRA